jgi:hypothetical protein
MSEHHVSRKTFLVTTAVTSLATALTGFLGGGIFGNEIGKGKGYQRGFDEYYPTVNAASGTITAQEAAGSVLKQDNINCNTEANDLRAVLVSKDQEIENIKVQLGEKDNKIAGLEAQLAQFNAATPIATPEPTQCPTGENPDHQRLTDFESQLNWFGLVIVDGTHVRNRFTNEVKRLKGVILGGCEDIIVFTADCLPTKTKKSGGNNGGTNPPPDGTPEPPPFQKPPETTP